MLWKIKLFFIFQKPKVLSPALTRLERRPPEGGTQN
jgi:hypothetical protein